MTRFFTQYKTLFVVGSNTTVQVLVMVFNFISFPIYLHYLGEESYGLVGVYGTLLAATSFLNFNIGNVMAREIPRMKSVGMNEGNINTIVFTSEVLFWLFGGLIGLLIGLFSTPLSEWINEETLSKSLIQECIWLMGGVIALNWPLQLYAGIFNGLNRQLDASSFYLIYNIFRIFGVIPFFYWYHVDIRTYFQIQFYVSLFFMIIKRFWVWHYLNVLKEKFKFKLSKIKEITGFLWQMSLVGILTVVASQLDKLFITSLLPLSNLTYYTTATLICSGVIIIGSTFNTYLLPNFTRFYFGKETERLNLVLQEFLYLSSAIVIPTSFFLYLFSSEILWVWTHNEHVTNVSSEVLKLLLISTTCLSLMNIPYTLLTATGNTKVIVLQYLGILIMGSPILYVLIQQYQLAGAAYFGIGSNVVYLIVGYWFLVYKMNLTFVKEVLIKILQLVLKIGVLGSLVKMIFLFSHKENHDYVVLIGCGIAYFMLYVMMQKKIILSFMRLLRSGI
ncbi:MAG: oligosaccharide flippase family protein [Rhodothermia bacterium]|nr:oligosaccharide flippase family protein [Rhodothermia bacterium]